MQENTLLENWLLLYRHKFMIMMIIIISMLVAGILSKTLQPVYEAKALCFVPQFVDIAALTSPTSDRPLERSLLMPATLEEPHAPYIGILKSSYIAELTVKEFPHRQVRELKRNVDFVLSDEFLLEIYARDNDPVKAAGICNAYVRNLGRIVNEISLLSVSKNEALLNQKIESTQKSLDQAKQNLLKFQKTNSISDINEELKHLISQKINFQGKYEEFEVGKLKNKSKIDALTKQLNQEAILFADSEFAITSPYLEKLREKLAEVKMDLAGLKSDLKEDHPDNIKLKEVHEEISKNIDREIRTLLDSKIKAPETFYEKIRQQLVNLFVDKESIMASIAAYAMVIDKIDDRIQRIPKLSLQLDSLKTDAERYRTLLQTLKKNLEEVKVQHERNLQSVVVVDNAIPPENPAFPVLWINLLAAAFFGFFISIAYCLLLAYIDRTRGERISKILRAVDKSRNM